MPIQLTLRNACSHSIFADRRVLWEELERIGVVGSNDGEVSAIDCRDSRYPETFRGGYYRAVDRPERQVTISAHQFRDSEPISCHNRLDGEVASSQVTEETNLSIRPQPASDEVDDFRDDQNGYYQRTGMMK